MHLAFTLNQGKMYSPSSQVDEPGLREVKKPPQILNAGGDQTQDLN